MNTIKQLWFTHSWNNIPDCVELKNCEHISKEEILGNVDVLELQIFCSLNNIGKSSYDYSMCSSVVTACYSPEPLLSSSIPLKWKKQQNMSIVK